MRTIALAVHPRASLALRLLYGRRTEKVALSPAAAARGARGWFTGPRAVFEHDLVRVVESPWPTIARRLALVVAVVAVGASAGLLAVAGMACAGYGVGAADACLRG